MDVPRTRDCIILFKGTTLPVTLGSAMTTGGWRGGQGVQWAGSTKDELKVDYSDGLYAGFMLWGSDESSDQYTAMTRQQPVYRAGVMGLGGWIICTVSYEQYTWNSRHGIGPPNVPIVYHASDRLLFSNRGLWTNEDEWTLSLDPRRPNSYYIGFLAQRPTPQNSMYMTIEVSL
jgi:hypothetical protein